MRRVESIERELRDIATRATELADELRRLRLERKRPRVRPLGADDVQPSEAARERARILLRKRGLL